MKILYFLLPFTLVLILTGCSKSDSESVGLYADTYSSGASSTDSGTGNNNQTGLITAGEWNDLDNWDFWLELSEKEAYSGMMDYWGFYPENRISVLVKNGIDPVVDAEVELMKNNDAVWKARTDNFGKAELWPGLFSGQSSTNLDDFSVRINGQLFDQSISAYSNGINEFEITGNSATATLLELCFIVDATGSMSDELEFLKDDLEDVISTVQNSYPAIDIRTSSVFYRDEGDQYILRSSPFTSKLSETLNFIDDQEADGGGDFPEAVHDAMYAGIEQLNWSENAKTRLAFLLLDAPPHYEDQVIDQLQSSVSSAANKGIKIIPITASGIDKETEFLMRFFAISTNGTYVFITNHSGIGNDHLEASVGEFEVEYLNELMVRLIGKYLE